MLTNSVTFFQGTVSGNLHLDFEDLFGHRLGSNLPSYGAESSPESPALVDEYLYAKTPRAWPGVGLGMPVVWGPVGREGLA